MKKGICSLLAAMVLAISFLIPAMAVDVPEEKTGTCSIEVIVQYQGRPVQDGILTAVRVGTMSVEHGVCVFRTVAEQEKIEQIGAWDTVEKMASYYHDRKDQTEFFEQTIRIRQGTAVFSGLDTGLYLIFQNDHDASTGFYPINAFWVSVPHWDGSQYQYDVQATVKTEPGQKPPEQPEKPQKPEPPEPEEPDTEVPPEPTVPELPVTGQRSWPVPVLALSGMLVFVVGWRLYTADRKDSHET